MDFKEHRENDIFTEDKAAGKSLAAAENTLEARRERYKVIIRNFTIMSDTFMRKVFDRRECVEYALRVIMGKPDLQVTGFVVQGDYKNLQGRSAILDCVVRDSLGLYYDLEIQQKDEGANPKRARYHSSLMDMNILEVGENFDHLPERYVIFITGKDPLGGRHPIYHIRKRIDESGKPFDDDDYVIYVNSSIQDDTELGRLMHDFHCKDAKDMYSEILAKRVRELKETQEGVEQIFREMEKMKGGCRGCPAILYI